MSAKPYISILLYLYDLTCVIFQYFKPVMRGFLRVQLKLTSFYSVERPSDKLLGE